MHEIGRLLTAMITPFAEDGSVNWDATQRLARQLCDQGSDGVVVAGTTGESPTLSDDEKVELVRVVRQAIPVVPYYNKPPQEGMFQHFRAISEVGPVIMYNIAGRTAINMTAATTLRCAELPNVIGVKEASGDITQIGLVCAGRPDGFRVWSGDDNFTLPLMAVGGHGVICVISHIAGPAMRAMLDAYAAGDNDEARRIHLGLLPVMQALMTVGPNPVPLKTVLNALGVPAGPFRLPLVPLPQADLDRVLAVVRAAGDLVSVRTGAHVG
jgi:4-hydroxy-tetrahydrodipicolinate synthase